jgi:type IV secretory pathway TrbD component
LLAAEFTLVLWVRGMSLQNYLATRDPVSGNVYLATLAIFALMPLLVRRRSV